MKKRTLTHTEDFQKAAPGRFFEMYADGGGQSIILNPLPRHILGQKFTTQDSDAFVASPFWTQEYVGAGPYKLDKWEPGSFLEGSAFDYHRKHSQPHRRTMALTQLPERHGNEPARNASVEGFHDAVWRSVRCRSCAQHRKSR